MLRTLASLLATLFTGCLVGLAVGVLFYGRSYYPLALPLRSEHALHAMLRPGGSVGIALGVLGTALMVAMLSYSVRKYFARVRLLGPLPAWLRFHMICGVMGPVLILLHGGLFLPSGLVAVGFWCMVLVALSGLFGRYVYGFFPSTAAGRVEDLGIARASLADLRARLVQETRDARAEQIGAAIGLARDLEVEVRSLFGLVRLDWEVRRRARAIRRLLVQAEMRGSERRSVARILVGQLKLKRSLETWEVAGRLLRYWHLFHLPLAKAMYLIVGLHVAAAVVFGGALHNLRPLFP